MLRSELAEAFWLLLAALLASTLGWMFGAVHGANAGHAHATCWAHNLAYIETTSAGATCAGPVIYPVLEAP